MVGPQHRRPQGIRQPRCRLSVICESPYDPENLRLRS